jgi:protein required for attachment to host cells
MRHAVERRHDPHRWEGRQFLAGIVERLSSASAKGEFDQLVLVAPPRALGELRRLMPAQLKEKTIGELAQDLTKADTASLAAHVAEFIAV